MVKMHKLTKGGQTIYPATIYDAVVNPKTRKSLTSELSDLIKEVPFQHNLIQTFRKPDLGSQKKIEAQEKF